MDRTLKIHISKKSLLPRLVLFLIIFQMMDVRIFSGIWFKLQEFFERWA